jgi:putative endopeptidase
MLKVIHLKKIFSIILSASILAACNNATSNANKADVLAVNMDTTLQPGEDIFQYANGGWIKNNPIPAEESQWGIGNLVLEENTKRLREISESAAKEKAAKGSASQKIGDFWQAAMDTLKIEKDGTTPLNSYFTKIAAINDTKSLLSLLAELDQIGVEGPIQFFVSQDAKNSDLNALQLWQTGIGLPEREYYFKNDSSTLLIRTAYVKNIIQTLLMIGDDSTKATKAATDILSIETSLAKAHRKMEDLRDPYANYNKMKFANLTNLCPSVNWDNYLIKNGIGKSDSVILGQPAYYQALNKLLKPSNLDTWKSMMRYRLTKRFSEVLPDKFGQLAFEFSKLFSGAKQRKPRWKRVIRAEENAMGELLGQLYVKEFFNEKAKQRYEKMVEDV